MPTVCVFGDSITWGAWDPEGGGWVDRLKVAAQEMTLRGRRDIQIFNCGVPGDRVGDVLRRMGVEGWARRPDRIILAVGINDTPHNGEAGTPPEDFQETYTALIEAAYELTRDVVIVGLTNVDESLLTGWTNDAVAVYNALVAEAAERHELTFVNPFGTLERDDLLPDGLHPSPSGHRKMAEMIAPHLF